MNDKLKKYIENSPYSVRQLALLLQIPKSTLHDQLKRGTIGVDTLEKIVILLNLSDEEILNLFGKGLND